MLQENCTQLASIRSFFENLNISSIAFSPNHKLPCSKGPTSYGPLIDAAVDIVEKNGGQFHVLVIVADGQVKLKAFKRNN